MSPPTVVTKYIRTDTVTYTKEKPQNILSIHYSNCSFEWLPAVLCLCTCWSLIKI
uniref:Uncharacterized protein n=1 Tax=Anguilla anguilla TaxID=7936 RepID=A0A0E9UI11_ANGAN